jgi:hypothetical protein
MDVKEGYKVQVLGEVVPKKLQNVILSPHNSLTYTFLTAFYHVSTD